MNTWPRSADPPGPHLLTTGPGEEEALRRRLLRPRSCPLRPAVQKRRLNAPGNQCQGQIIPGLGPGDHCANLFASFIGFIFLS